jgi:hypothetical protein
MLSFAIAKHNLKPFLAEYIYRKIHKKGGLDGVLTKKGDSNKSPFRRIMKKG